MRYKGDAGCRRFGWSYDRILGHICGGTGQQYVMRDNGIPKRASAF